MTEIEFRQPARQMSLIIGVAYVAIVLGVAFTFFDQLSEVVNDLAGGGYMATGILVAAVCFIPLLAAIALLRQKVILRQDASTLTVKIGRREGVIPRQSIRRVVVHEPALGPVRLYSAADAVLLTLNPPKQEYSRVVGFLINERGYSEVSRQLVFGGRMTAITYISDTQP